MNVLYAVAIVKNRLGGVFSYIGVRGVEANACDAERV
jgi:hypothetical protein